MWTFYILYSISRDRFYVGFTGDSLEERLRKHNSKHIGFTGKTGDWEIKYFKIFSTKEEAYRREREIKNWKSRIRIKKLFGSERSG